jgi:putative phage-type endonuclease
MPFVVVPPIDIVKQELESIIECDDSMEIIYEKLPVVPVSLGESIVAPIEPVVESVCLPIVAPIESVGLPNVAPIEPDIESVPIEPNVAPIEPDIESVPIEPNVAPIEPDIESVPIEPVVESVPIEPVVESVPFEPVVAPIEPIIAPIEPVVESVPIEPVVESVPIEPVVESVPIEPVVAPIAPIEPINESVVLPVIVPIEPIVALIEHMNQSIPIETIVAPIEPIGAQIKSGDSTISPMLHVESCAPHVESNMEKIERYLKLPHYKQKSIKWLDQRNDYLTASTIAAAIGVMGQAARNNLLISKVSHGAVGGFTGNVATHWGNKYEAVANAIYSYRNNDIKIYEFGMVTNTKYPFLGVSPDGITTEKMLEIKCPFSRIIDGKIKTEYYHQMQEQMAVCEFDKCDFLECRFEETSEMCFWDDFYYYNEDDNINREKGIIMSCLNLDEEELEYIYSPIEYITDVNLMKNWEQTTIEKLRNSNNKIYMYNTYWYCIKYNCQLVERDPTWITDNYPILQKFWDDVILYRKIGVDKLHEKMKKKYCFSDDSEKDVDITHFLHVTDKVDKKKSRCLL